MAHLKTDFKILLLVFQCLIGLVHLMMNHGGGSILLWRCFLLLVRTRNTFLDIYLFITKYNRNHVFSFYLIKSVISHQPVA